MRPATASILPRSILLALLTVLTVLALLTLLTVCAVPSLAAADDRPMSDPPAAGGSTSDPPGAPCTDTDEEPCPAATVEATIVVTSGLPSTATETRVGGDAVESTGAPDLAAALAQVPGLAAIRRGAINLEPSIRGLQEDQVASMVDGTRTFAAGPARMDSNISHVGPHAVESVRVVKGPYALTWGAGTLSALDVRTHRGSFRPSGFGVEPLVGVAWSDAGGDAGGEGDGLDAYAGLRGGGARLRIALDLGQRDGDDYQAGDGSLVEGDYRSREARLRLGWQATEALVLDLSTAIQDQDDLDYPGRLLNARRFDTRSYALRGVWSDPSGAARLEGVEATLYANRKDHRMTNDGKPTARDMPGRTPPFALDIDLPTESNTAGGRLRTTWSAGERSEWIVGGDGYQVEQTATRTVARRSNGVTLFEDIVWPDSSIEALGAYAQWSTRRDVSRLGPGTAARWGVAVRVDSVDAAAGEVSQFYRETVLAGDGEALDQSESHVSAALDAGLELAGGWSLRAGLGTAVRTATALERWSDRFPASRFQIAAEFVGDPTLDPERSLELDAGLRYTDARWTLRADAFVRQIDDFITIAPDSSLPKRLPLSPPTVYRYVNGTRAESVGAELSVDHRPSDRWSWHADAEWLRGDDETLDEPLLGVSPLTVHVATRVAAIADRLWLDARLRWTDDQDRVAASRFEQPTPGATLLAIGAEWSLRNRVTIDLDVENLTDEAYADHLDAPNPFTGRRILAPGRTLRLGLRWRG